MLMQCKERKCLGIYQSNEYPGYIIEVIDLIDEDVYEAWLSHKDYGVKSLMFGLLKKDVSYEEMLGIVEENLDEYIGLYIFDYEDCED